MVAGALSDSGIKHGSVVDAVVVVGEALTDETLQDAVGMWCKGGSDREAVVARFGEIGDWDVSAVTSFRELFHWQEDFNEDISRWDTSNVTTMYGMFNCASSFNQSVEGWNTSNVTDMRYMFNNAGEFNADISKWNVEKVTNMRSMFENAKKFKADIGATWSGSAATDTQKDIFLGADAFNELYECETLTNGPVSSCEKVRPPSPWRCD